MNYLFRCRNCKHEETYERPIDRRDDPALCPVCDETMRRVFLPISSIFRGSGFYSTDKHLTKVDPLDYDPNVHTRSDIE